MYLDDMPNKHLFATQSTPPMNVLNVKPERCVFGSFVDFAAQRPGIP